MTRIQRKFSCALRELGIEPLERRTLLSALNPTNLTAVGSRVFFLGEDSTHGRELWTSDGTRAGTRMVRDIMPGTLSSNITALTQFGDRVAFAANDGSSGMELWVSDGTSAGTFLVKDILGGSESSLPFGLKGIGNVLYFSASTNQFGRELWKSDGTAAGTVMIKDIYPGNIGSGPTAFTDVNGTVFFSAEHAVTTGSGNHTTTTYFGRELWKTNGTAAGTVMVKDINPNFSSSGPTQLTNVNGTLFFTAYTSQLGMELWKSNGTASGTTVVEDINPTFRSSNPGFLRAHDGAAYFNATDGNFAHSLWRSNGTVAGTAIAADFAPGFQGFITADFQALGQAEFFLAFSFTSGALELWRTDQTAAGTRFLATALPPDIFQNNPYIGAVLARSGQQMFFTAFEESTGSELYVTDGTIAGTRLVKNIFPGGGQVTAQPAELTDVNGKLFFVHEDGVHGRELWMSDGTTRGTTMPRFSDARFAMPVLSSQPLRSEGGAVFSNRVIGSLFGGSEERADALT